MASKLVRWITIFWCVALVCEFEEVCVNGDTYTTNNDYDPSAHNYSLYGLFRATWDSNKSLEWRRQYYWTAYCDQEGKPMGKSLCGTCIQVTNDSTGQSVTVRIVDECENGGLDLETAAFNGIDGDGQGVFHGHMFTTYEFVDC